MTPPIRPLTEDDKLFVFRTATGCLTSWYADDIAKGMNDAELEAALVRVLGIYGGSGGPDQPDVCFQGAGLKIWGGWEFQTPRDKPLFAGKTTIAMARRVYAIPNPDKRQLDLF